MRRERPRRYVLPCVGKGLQVGVVVGCVLLELVAYYAPMAGLLAFVLWPVLVAMGGLCGALWGLCREVAAVPNRRTRLALQLGLAGLAIMLVAWWQWGRLRGLVRPGTGTEPVLDRPRRVARPAPSAAERQRDYAAAHGFPVRVVNTIGMEFRLVPPGELRGESGADAKRQGEAAGGANRPTRIDQPLYVGVHEITRGQWAAVMGIAPGQGMSPDPSGQWIVPRMPADRVSWDDCQIFIQRLCGMEGAPAGTYRLLTEAEWEYACRTGTRSPFNGKRNRTGAQTLDPLGWCVRNSGGGLHAVGEKLPNGWGLYDMHGNVAEWVGDAYLPDALGLRERALAPAGAGTVADRYAVVRGGSCFSREEDCRSGSRSVARTSVLSAGVGFRLAREPAVSNVGLFEDAE